MRGKNLKYDLEAWKQAYQEKVREVTGFKWYKTKANANAIFEKLVKNYPEVNPSTFMEATFPPNKEWYVPKKGGSSKGWKKLQYPYPNMLLSEKAYSAYKKHLKLCKAERYTFEEEVLTSVKQSLQHLKETGVSAHDYSELFWQAHSNYISPYLFVSLPNAIAWAMLQSSKGEIPQDLVEEILQFQEKLRSHMDLKFKIRKLIGAYERN